MSIYRGAGGSGDATNDATVSQVQTYASQAATSATNAAASATAAAASESGATTQAALATSAKNDSVAISNTVAGYVAGALASETAASGSATAAAASAAAAALSEGNASGSASDAADSATTATNQATAASTSATNSANSAASALAIYGNTTAMNTAVTNASNSATAAATSATNASTSASNASTSASAASSSASAASTSASAAATSAGNAASSASNAATSEANTLSIYGSTTAVNDAVNNSLANRNAAAASATAASTSASASATSATASASSASAAATSAAAASAVALGNEPVRHSVRPSLLLDFANTKQLDPRITFTRASTATFYDGKTTAKAEENLLTFSEQFDNAAWTTEFVVKTANTIAAPDGTTTADTLSDNASLGVHQSRNATGIVIPNTEVTASIFLKNNTRQFGCLSIYDGSTYHGIVVDLSIGTITQTNGTLTSSSITSVGNGWYRLIITKTINASTFLSVSTSNTGTPASLNLNRPSYTGDGSSIYVWGAQLEQRSSVTAYTPTTTAPITNYIPALQTAASGTARFDHNPTTGESLGLLIEEQRTNLVVRSEEFDNSSWLKTSATITANTIIAPDGNLTSDKLVEAAAAGLEHMIEQIVSTTTNQTYTQSIYVKAAETTSFSLMVVAVGSSTTTSYSNFTIAAGVITAVSSNGLITSASTTPVGNGWYRCAIVYTLNGTVTSHRMRVYPRQTGLYTGDGTSGIYIWGAQLEAGAFATSYIPTVASQVTRSPDAASMTGTNFSSWYRLDQGTFYAEASTFTTASKTGNPASVASIDDNSPNNRLQLRYGANFGSFSPRLVENGAGILSTTLTGLSINVNNKHAIGYQTGSSASVGNGTIIENKTTTFTPIAGTALYIGSGNTSDSLNGTIKKISYYTTRLTNAELQGLTTN